MNPELKRILDKMNDGEPLTSDEFACLQYEMDVAGIDDEDDQ